MSDCLNGHTFTPLRPGYEPDDLTPCDCGAISWRDWTREQLRARVEASLERESHKRSTPPAPGPDPNLCNEPNQTGGICGGPMSPPIRGHRTGLWLRTCRACQTTTGTTEAPAPAAGVRPPDLPVPGALFHKADTIRPRELRELLDRRGLRS